MGPAAGRLSLSFATGFARIGTKGRKAGEGGGSGETGRRSRSAFSSSSGRTGKGPISRGTAPSRRAASFSGRASSAGSTVCRAGLSTSCCPSTGRRKGATSGRGFISAGATFASALGLT